MIEIRAKMSRGEYIVVVNQEGQYSIWASGEPLPPGWNDAGKHGSKEECLGYIEENWTDMRPRALGIRWSRRNKVHPKHTLVEQNRSSKQLGNRVLCIHHLIEANAQSRPDAIALVYENYSLDLRPAE